MFSIHYGQTPYILLIHEGYAYKYSGNNKDRTALINFAVNSLEEFDSCEGDGKFDELGDQYCSTRVKVPSMPTMWDELSELIEYSVQ